MIRVKVEVTLTHLREQRLNEIRFKNMKKTLSITVPRVHIIF